MTISKAIAPTLAATAILLVPLAPAAFAQDTGTNTMSHSDKANDTMGKSQDTMGKDTMGKDTMGKDTMGKDTMGKDTMGKDTMGKDTMGKDTMGKDTMGKDEMKTKTTE